MKNYIIVFKNTHDAMEGEKILNENLIKIMIMPTPTHITQSCGISIRFSENEILKVEELISNNKVATKNIYEYGIEGFNIYR